MENPLPTRVRARCTDSTPLVTHDDGVAKIVLGWPTRNTFTHERVLALGEALETAVADVRVKCVCFVSAVDGYFSDGYSKLEMFRVRSEAEFRHKLANFDDVRAVYKAIACCPLPTFSIVDGLCRGAGIELALVCDLILGTPPARFALHEVDFGFVPGLGGHALAQQRMRGHAHLRMLLTGHEHSSASALHAGLIDHVAPDERAALRDHVAPVATRDRDALVRIKQLVSMGAARVQAIDSARAAFVAAAAQFAQRRFGYQGKEN